MTQEQERKLSRLLEQGESERFYDWRQWDRTKACVLEMDRYECQMCKERGRYTRAVIVHHVKHLKDRPDLALSIWDPETGERQLLSVCKACHEQLHPERMRQYVRRNRLVTEERWD